MMTSPTREIGIRVVYRDRDMQPMYTRTYTIKEYTEMLRADLLRLVTDIEDLCYAANDGRAKEDWSEETFSGFNKIKHKLLDKAGDVGRIPENMIEVTHESMSAFLASVLEEE